MSVCLALNKTAVHTLTLEGTKPKCFEKIKEQCRYFLAHMQVQLHDDRTGLFIQFCF